MDIIESALALLLREQQPDGSFLGYSSNNPNNFSTAKTYHTPFPTATIVNALTPHKDNVTVTKIYKKAVDYLLRQRSPHWSFNYWDRGSFEAKQHPYPDDLDDTFAALSAIYSTRRQRLMARI
jgi:hypothetical protein